MYFQVAELQEIHDETIELDEIHSGSPAFLPGTSLNFKISLVTSMRERTYLEVIKVKTYLLILMRNDLK